MITYFKGFNGLRFLAAFLVLVSHAYQSVVKQNFELPNFVNNLHIFYKGQAAVDFFFTLSGFLITYLLLKEQRKTNTISIKKFYLRRVMRIWPLYFLILVVGLIILTIIYPVFTGGGKFLKFNETLHVLILYIVFLPNLASSIYKVGMLYPLWSIGVEEQFYLIWAPLVKWLKAKIIPAALILFTLSFIFYLLPKIFNLNDIVIKFLETLRFNYMSIGALFAAFVYKLGLEKLKVHFINSRLMRLVVPILILIFLNTFNKTINIFVFNLFVSLLYGILLIQVFTVEKAWIKLETKTLRYLGSISYGIYMFHLTIEYILRAISLKLKLSNHLADFSIWYFLLYLVLLLIFTVIVSGLSLRYFESYFLKLKHKKYAV